MVIEEMLITTGEIQETAEKLLNKAYEINRLAGEANGLNMAIARHYTYWLGGVGVLMGDVAVMMRDTAVKMGQKGEALKEVFWEFKKMETSVTESNRVIDNFLIDHLDCFLINIEKQRGSVTNDIHDIDLICFTLQQIEGELKRLTDGIQTSWKDWIEEAVEKFIEKGKKEMDGLPELLVATEGLKEKTNFVGQGIKNEILKILSLYDDY